MWPTHRVLIVGVGSIGERHLRCFQQTGRCEISFAEVNEPLRQTIADRYGVRGFASLDEAVSQRPSVAVVCTPAHLHVPMATQLADAGIHLLIEKPLSTGLDGIEQLRETIERRRIACSVAYVYRAHPVLTAMREAILSGRFGRPLQLIAVSGQHFPTYRPAYREIYYKDRATGGGAIQDALTHVINASEWLIGPVTRLVADAAHQRLEGVSVEDTVHLLARHGDVLASYSINQHQAANENTITVVCDSGTVRFEGHECRWRWLTTPGESWHDEPHPPLERDAMFIAQANQFLDAVEGKRPVACSLDEGLQTLRVNLAALASADGGGWQNITSSNRG
ncbi:MAG TPA: Gfo/Idh/MocA family oxidoreductase [Pirellulaceae bacterium]|nr:Gfo/Idh/MocA family oxidoreductase [Pirellulaceae bacterium]